MRIGAVDVGTNTALLLIADVVDGAITDIHTQKRHFVRLGEGLENSGFICKEAIQRYATAVKEFSLLADEYSVESLVVAGTSASRDAGNVDVVRQITRDALGVHYEILSGDEEARWSYVGAISSLPPQRANGPLAVLDIGGGSTEFVVDSLNEELDYRSWNLGSVRVAEKCFSSQPPSAVEIEIAREYIASAISDTQFGIPNGCELLGVAGTMSTIAFLEGNCTGWHDIEEIAPVLSRNTVDEWRDRLLKMSFQEAMALNPAVMKGRADVLPAGILLLSMLMHRFEFNSITAVRGGLRHGLAIMQAERVLSAS